MDKELLKQIALQTDVDLKTIVRILEDKELLNVFKILMNNEISENYLGTNDISDIMFRILLDEKLREDVKNIPQEFWNKAKEKGLKVYTELLTITEFSEDTEDKIIYRYQTQKESDIPFLIYQKQYQKEYRR